MFSKNQEIPEIDAMQREMFEHARKRIVQKKRLFQHFVFFIVCAIFMLILNLGFGIGKEITLLGFDWYVIVIMIWAFLFIMHCCNVWLFSKFMGQEWTDRQMERLVAKQKLELANMQREVDLKYPKPQLSNKQEKIIPTIESSVVLETQVGEVKEEKTFSPPSKQIITMIAAAGENEALGKDNDLVWHLPDDFKRFKKLTTGHHIIMGRKTFESFPKPLPNRIHVVITRNKEYKPEGAIVVYSMDEALVIAKDDLQPFIIGGGEIYKLGLQYADRIELTRVHGQYDADTYFPEIDPEIWEIENRELHGADERHEVAFTYITYKRK